MHEMDAVDVLCQARASMSHLMASLGLSERQEHAYDKHIQHSHRCADCSVLDSIASWLLMCGCARRSEMRVTWTQRFSQTPVVRYGPAPNTGAAPAFTYPLSVVANASTYFEGDLCGDPDQTSGWFDPGTVRPLVTHLVGLFMLRPPGLYLPVHYMHNIRGGHHVHLCLHWCDSTMYQEKTLPCAHSLFVLGPSTDTHPKRPLTGPPEHDAAPRPSVDLEFAQARLPVAMQPPSPCPSSLN